MQRRVVALVAAAVVVVAALVVLRWRAGAPAENAAVAPDEAIHAEAGESRPGSNDTAGHVPVTAARPLPSLRAPAANGAEGENRASAATATAERPPAAPALPPGAPQEMVILHNSIVDAYERSDFEASFQGAQDFLRSHQPDNVYLKRVAAVSACAIGDASSARAYYDQLDAAEQRIVSARCDRYGVSF